MVEMDMWRVRGALKLQRFQIGNETHITERRMKRRWDHTNLIFLKRGNADNEDLEVNYS